MIHRVSRNNKVIYSGNDGKIYPEGYFRLINKLLLITRFTDEQWNLSIRRAQTHTLEADVLFILSTYIQLPWRRSVCHIPAVEHIYLCEQYRAVPYHKRSNNSL